MWISSTFIFVANVITIWTVGWNFYITNTILRLRRGALFTFRRSFGVTNDNVSGDCFTVHPVAIKACGTSEALPFKWRSFCSRLEINHSPSHASYCCALHAVKQALDNRSIDLPHRSSFSHLCVCVHHYRPNTPLVPTTCPVIKPRIVSGSKPPCCLLDHSQDLWKNWWELYVSNDADATRFLGRLIVYINSRCYVRYRNWKQFIFFSAKMHQNAHT